MKVPVRTLFLTALGIWLGACAGTEAPTLTAEALRQNIAAAYGVQGFEKITRIHFIFNHEADGRQIERKWVWSPKTDDVIYRGITSQLHATEYNRNALAGDTSGRARQIDQWFENDIRWLLFPFRLAWDREADIEMAGRHFLPIGWGRANRVVVRYPPEEGSAPGDVYELYVDENYRLIQWVWRRGGADPSVRISTWDDHRQVGPITIAMAHEGKSGDFRLWFSDVAVQLEGAEEWVPAQ